MKYDNMPIKKDMYGFEYADNNHILGESKPCIQCGTFTRAIDVFSERHICSEECQRKWDYYYNMKILQM